jgi:Domain of unknown function (DUF1707)
MTESIERTHVSASNDYRYDVGEGPRDRSLRVGDKERDAVSEILRQRHLEGRVDTDEFQARLERCLAAKTYADLDELIADFPGDGAERRWDRQSWTWRPWPLPFLFLPLALIAAIVVGGHLAWLALPLSFFFVLRTLAWGAWGRGYGRGFWTCGPRRTTRV